MGSKMTKACIKNRSDEGERMKRIGEGEEVEKKKKRKRREK
jgi:hypothetical protein